MSVAPLMQHCGSDGLPVSIGSLDSDLTAIDEQTDMPVPKDSDIDSDTDEMQQLAKAIEQKTTKAKKIADADADDDDDDDDDGDIVGAAAPRAGIETKTKTASLPITSSLDRTFTWPTDGHATSVTHVLVARFRPDTTTLVNAGNEDAMALTFYGGTCVIDGKTVPVFTIRDVVTAALKRTLDPKDTLDIVVQIKSNNQVCRDFFDKMQLPPDKGFACKARVVVVELDDANKTLAFFVVPLSRRSDHSAATASAVTKATLKNPPTVLDSFPDLEQLLKYAVRGPDMNEYVNQFPTVDSVLQHLGMLSTSNVAEDATQRIKYDGNTSTKVVKEAFKTALLAIVDAKKNKKKTNKRAHDNNDDSTTPPAKKVKKTPDVVTAAAVNQPKSIDASPTKRAHDDDDDTVPPAKKAKKTHNTAAESSVPMQVDEDADEEMDLSSAATAATTSATPATDVATDETSGSSPTAKPKKPAAKRPRPSANKPSPTLRFDAWERTATAAHFELTSTDSMQGKTVCAIRSLMSKLLAFPADNVVYHVSRVSTDPDAAWRLNITCTPDYEQTIADLIHDNREIE